MDIIENDIDVALRTGYVKDSRLVARRLSPMDFLICVSPQYLEAHGTPSCPEDFQRHQWIGFRIKETKQLQPIFLPDDKGEYLPHELERSHITDDGEAMAHMCADGLGFAQLPHFLAKKGLNSGALVSLYPYLKLPQPDSGVFAIYPKREHLPAKVRVFIEFLTASLAAMGESPNREATSEMGPGWRALSVPRRRWLGQPSPSRQRKWPCWWPETLGRLHRTSSDTLGSPA